MRRFRLADRDLGALAAGRPSPGTLGELRKAQLSRHLLLLSEILKAETPLWYAGSPSRTILADPATGLYAATTLSTMRNGGRPPDRPTLVGTAPTVAVTCENLTLRVRLEDADPLRDRLGLPPTGHLSPAEVTHWRQMLSECWQSLVRRHRPAAEILAEVLQVIIPVQPDPAADAISATSAHAYGAVAMSAPTDPLSLTVGLIHETAHSLLNATTLLFDLVRPTTALGYSPWRDDPRPTSGVLHGAYAYLAVTRFWRTEATLGGGRRAEFEFARWRAAVAAAADSLLVAKRTEGPDTELSTGAPHDLQFLATIENGGGPRRKGVDSGFKTGKAPYAGPVSRSPAGEESVLTPAGRRFVGALRDEVGQWLDEPVDAEVARLAHGANVDHWVRWRLRNLRVSPASTRALVDAWENGRPPPELPAPEVVAGARRLEVSGRLALVHRWLRDDTAAGRDAEPNGEDGAAPRPERDALPDGDHDAARDTPPDRDHDAVRDTPADRDHDAVRDTPADGYDEDGGGGDQRAWPGGGVRPGDVAWLGGEYGAGRDGYVRGLEIAGETDAALAGLALVSGPGALRQRPEVVRAVWAALEPRPAVEALVEWLS
ncbi:aKG-HExxH-type peptide beta-hydroxylase [Actinoplanes sp. NPDC051343]|uniref:aKG-HExxH-type peptide beta-hydroxylase n=1 Tax=Actinoplanes sp. NPDC051343 TaxID=3363906 RepID=UPI0037ACA418